MSIKDTIKSLGEIETWNKSPWDKVSHTLLGLLFGAIPFYFWGVEAGTTVGTVMLYGREQSQDEKNSGYIKSWFPWYWKMDGKLDVAIPAILMYGIFYGVNSLGIL